MAPRDIKKWLAGLSFRTGLWVAASAVVFYAVSFGQFWLPLSIETKGVLWFIFFGCAKTAQYSALLILGKEGIARLKRRFRKAKADLP